MLEYDHRGWPCSHLRARHEAIDFLCLQALGVPLVADLAGGAGNASSWASPSIATALSPLRSSSGGRRGGGLGWCGAGGGGGASASARAGTVGRANGANLDVGVGDGGVGDVGLDIAGDTGGGGAGTTLGAELGGVGGEGAVEPEHVGCMVIPDAHDENHTILKSGAHVGEATVLGEVVGVAEYRLLGSAEIGGDRVAAGASDGGDRVGDDDAILDVEALDVGESTGGGSVIGDELGDDGELGLGVDGLAWAVEVEAALAVRVEVTSIRVASSSITVVAVSSTASIASAHGLAGSVARVGSVGVRDGVGLPEIHLSTARTVVTDTGVRIVGRLEPSLNVTLHIWLAIESTFSIEFLIPVH